MDSILDIVQEIRNLHTVPANIRYQAYDIQISRDTTTMKGVVLHKILIFNNKATKKDIQKVKEGEYSQNCVMISQEQFEKVFLPLFKEIGRLNAQVRNLQNKI